MVGKTTEFVHFAVKVCIMLHMFLDITIIKYKRSIEQSSHSNALHWKNQILLFWTAESHYEHNLFILYLSKSLWLQNWIWLCTRICINATQQSQVLEYQLDLIYMKFTKQQFYCCHGLYCLDLSIIHSNGYLTDRSLSQGFIHHHIFIQLLSMFT